MSHYWRNFLFCHVRRFSMSEIPSFYICFCLPPHSPFMRRMSFLRCSYTGTYPSISYRFLHVYMSKPPHFLCMHVLLQVPPLLYLFVRLNLVIRLETLKVFQADAAFCSLAHFLDIFLHMFEGVYLACL